jgi:hypothetical protein
MVTFNVICGQILAFLIKFLSGLAFVLAAFIAFGWLYDKEIAALLTIAFSDLYWGQWTKK